MARSGLLVGRRGARAMLARRLVGGMATAAATSLVMLSAPLATTGASAATAKSTSTPPYSVYVGYTDTLRPDPRNFPTPFSGASGVVYEGCAMPCSAGLDGGAVMIVNSTSSAETINSVVVSFTASCVYDIWPHTVSLPAHEEMVIAENAGGGPGGCTTGTGQMDSSDIGPGGGNWAGNCNESGIIPTVDVTEGGTSTVYNDSGQVLNTGGVDLASCPVGGTNESTPWTPIGHKACMGAKLSLTPGTQEATPSTEVTLTATVANGCGNGLVGVPVSLDVQRGPNAGTTVTGTTNSSGKVALKYTGGAGKGLDVDQAATSGVAGTFTSPPATVGWGNAKLTLTPSQGAVGAKITSSGSGFQSGEPVDLYWNTNGGTPIATTTASSTGTFSAVTWKAPSSAGAVVPVYAIGQTSGDEAVASYIVDTGVSAVSATLSSAAVMAERVTYTVGLTTSTTGALSGGSGTITVQAPWGTVFADPATVADSTAGWGPTGATIVVVDNGTVATVTVPNNVNPGDALTLNLYGVTNDDNTASQVLTASTSSDTLGVAIPFTLSAAQGVGGLSVVPSSSASNANQVVYTVSFSASTTGALVNADGVAGAITVQAPIGTIFNNSANLADGTGHWSQGVSVTVVDHGTVASVSVPQPVNANDALTLTLNGVTNTNTSALSSPKVSVWTSSDTASASVAWSTTADAAVSSVAASLTSTSAGAGPVTYSISFTTSGAGALADSGGYQGDIVLQAPPGTIFTNSANLHDVTAGWTDGVSVTVSDHGLIATVFAPQPIATGHALLLTMYGVTN
ncbi:MAG: hypothetical protein ACYDD4_04325, partial [Acidimicrobiales bacterium]